MLRNPVLRAKLVELAAGGGLQWVGYMSSIGVYGDQAGAATDERTAANPRTARAKKRRRAELQWEAVFPAGGPVQLQVRGQPSQVPCSSVSDGTAYTVAPTPPPPTAAAVAHIC